MAASTTLCGPCSERHITKTSAFWCSECEEAICNDCQEHHKVLKATRSHELIPIDKYKSLPSFITDIQQSCTNHNEKYQHYCVTHALPICFKCIKEHQRCNVIPLEEITSNAKTSGQLQDLETRLVDLLQNFNRIGKDRMANLARIEERKELHLAEIKQIRHQINKHLDKLENEIIQDIEKKECQYKENIQKVLSSVKEKKNLITEYQTNLQSLTQHASNLQTFLVMRNIEVKVLENEQYLQSSVENNKFETVDLVFKVDSGVRSILNRMKTFGSIETKNNLNNIRLIRTKDKQAQLQITPTKTINDLQLILQKKILTRGEHIRCCCMSVIGEYFFTDYKRTLNVISSDGTFKCKIVLHAFYGFGITFIDEKTIAITTGGSLERQGVEIIDTERRKKIMVITLPGCPWGITRDQDSLFVCVEGYGIYKINTVDDTTSQVISCFLPGGSFISVFADKIYHTNWYDNSVVCYDRKGSRVWTFKDESVLRYPRGITVDNDGNVYVVGEKSSNVIIISNDGKHHKQILTKEDGLYEPSGIFFDKQTMKMLVANKKETAFLYSVAYND